MGVRERVEWVAEWNYNRKFTHKLWEIQEEKRIDRRVEERMCGGTYVVADLRWPISFSSLRDTRLLIKYQSPYIRMAFNDSSPCVCSWTIPTFCCPFLTLTCCPLCLLVSSLIGCRDVKVSLSTIFSSMSFTLYSKWKSYDYWHIIQVNYHVAFKWGSSCHLTRKSLCNSWWMVKTLYGCIAHVRLITKWVKYDYLIVTQLQYASEFQNQVKNYWIDIKSTTNLLRGDVVLPYLFTSQFYLNDFK